MLMRLMSEGEYLIVPKGTKFRGSSKLGLSKFSAKAIDFGVRTPPILSYLVKLPQA